MAKSIAQKCRIFTGLYESELLTELLLRHWKHPLAADETYRDALLEAASDVLRSSIRGERLFDDISPSNVNFVAALWYAEWGAIQQAGDLTSEERSQREVWLERIRREIPACFCDPEFLL